MGSFAEGAGAASVAVDCDELAAATATVALGVGGNGRALNSRDAPGFVQESTSAHDQRAIRIEPRYQIRALVGRVGAPLSSRKALVWQKPLVSSFVIADPGRCTLELESEPHCTIA